MKNPDITLEKAKQIAQQLGAKLDMALLEQFQTGLKIELEHGLANPQTNLTNDDLLLTGKIALIHLQKVPDYYIRLVYMLDEAKEYWEKHGRPL